MIHQAPQVIQSGAVGSAYAALPQGARMASSYGGQPIQYMGQQPMQAAQFQKPLQSGQLQPQQLPVQQQGLQQQTLQQQPRPQQTLQQPQQQQQPQLQQAQQQQPQTQQLQAPQPQTGASAVSQAAGLPASPKTKSAAAPGVAPPVTAGSMGRPMTTASGGYPMGLPAPVVQQIQGLEQRVRELEHIVGEKDDQIKELQAALTRAGVKHERPRPKPSPVKNQGGVGFQKLTGSKPQVRYVVTDQNDPVDVRLEEFYNSTGSAVQFRRINHGFYRFGETIVELNIINHKLMARTEDGWNRGKFGPIEKFLMYYENIEREKAGIIPEA